MSFAISEDFIAAGNASHAAALAEDYEALGRQLARRGISIEAMTERAMSYAVAVPTWGVGTGGTRFARFPGPGEPRNIHEGDTQRLAAFSVGQGEGLQRSAPRGGKP